MQFAPWKIEWAKFTDEAIEEMKRHSDDTHTEREWMTYIYEEDFGIMVADGDMPTLYRDKSGKQVLFQHKEEAHQYMNKFNIAGEITPVYHLGSVSYGDESRIEVNPATKEMQDAAMKQVDPDNRKWTIHGHPLKDGKIYTGRQYFSSTDILQEFIKARDTDQRVVQFIVYPHQQKDTNTGKKAIHNRCRILIFPDAATLNSAMKSANPNVDVKGISVENGFNSNAPDGSLKNEAGVDWFAFQEALGKTGHMGIIDIEGKKAGSKKAEGKFNIFGAEGSGLRSRKTLNSLAAVALFGSLVYFLFVSDESPLDIMVEDMNAEAEEHWWHR